MDTVYPQAGTYNFTIILKNIVKTEVKYKLIKKNNTTV